MNKLNCLIGLTIVEVDHNSDDGRTCVVAMDPESGKTVILFSQDFGYCMYTVPVPKKRGRPKKKSAVVTIPDGPAYDPEHKHVFDDNPDLDPEEFSCDPRMLNVGL